MPLVIYIYNKRAIYKHQASADTLVVDPYSVQDCSSTEMFENLKASKACFIC